MHLDEVPVTGEAVPLPSPPRRTFFHPLSGALILGIDFLAFGGELASGFLDTIPMCVLAFTVTLAAVFFVQRRLHRDRPAAAFGKAFLGAFAAGLPFSIAGGFLGVAILALAGLPDPRLEVKKAVWRRLTSRKR